MERDEFLKSLGLGLALVCTGSCFTACSKGGDDEANPDNGGNQNGNTVSVDISTLANVGSKTILSGIAFFRIAAGNEASSFIATDSVCTHQGGNLSWVQSENKIRCTSHGAEFNSSGTVLQGPATSALKTYAVTIDGTKLKVNKA